MILGLIILGALLVGALIGCVATAFWIGHGMFKNF